MLDEYRRSFGNAYETVVRGVRETLKLEPTGRPAKSTTSIIEKLRRESIRLTQIQDVAGCRVVVPSVLSQDVTVRALTLLFPGATIADRRRKPSHGYRAVHVIPRVGGRSVEIQVRSFLQHLWAELSEKLADVRDPAIKYGGGNATDRNLLLNASAAVQQLEAAEEELPAGNAELQRQQADNILEFKLKISLLLTDYIAHLDKRGREK